MAQYHATAGGNIMSRLLMESLHGRKGYMKLTYEDLAERLHKDISTIKRQMALDGNSSIATLDEIAAAMDSVIVLISSDSLADYQDSGVPRAAKNLADLDREIERLTAKLNEKDELIAQKERRIDQLLDLIEKLTRTM